MQNESIHFLCLLCRCSFAGEVPSQIIGMSRSQWGIACWDSDCYETIQTFQAPLPVRMIHFRCFTRTAPGWPRGLYCSSVTLGPAVLSVCCLMFHQSVPVLWLLLLQKSWAFDWDGHLISSVRKLGGRREDSFLRSPLLKGKIWTWANLSWESWTQTLLQLSKAVHMHWNSAINWLLITIKKQPEVPGKSFRFQHL